jgi:hydroxymethylpyrimidine/phosphomethylpyrimidine kinase
MFVSGAGIQADLKTFTSLETFGTSVLTSITSQNTLKVDGIHAIPAAFVTQQLEAVLSDIGTGAIKMGKKGCSKWISRERYPEKDHALSFC